MSPQLIIRNKKIIDKFFSDSDFFDILLKNRQIKKNEYQNFFNPPYPVDSDFDVSKKEIKKGLNRLNLAIKNKENILIYGDYDVDGLTSTAILWQVLHQLGAKVLPFIPDREVDGYGFKSKSFFNFEDEKKIHFDLLITVDNGIVANKELSKIIKNNTDIIIIDHHLSTKNLPIASAIIHSTKFSGSSLSWYFASKLDKKADIGLASIGTVADCLPLIGTNRNIVVHGLQSLRLNPNPGIKKIIEISGLKQDSISAYDLGFVVGPRLNAVGRLSNPIEALRLLCSQNLNQASKFAINLDKFNKDRQLLQKDSLKTAEEENLNNKNKLIFISNKDFLPGIIGLIAGRLTEKYYLPSIIISIGDKYSKASCRSIKELNIIETLRQFDKELVELGGHSGAAGFTIKTENINKFKDKITKYINNQLKDINLRPSIYVDSEMKLSAVNVKNCKLINKLEPFGIDNPKPVFLFKNIRIVQKRAIGLMGDHLKLKLDDPQTSKVENIIADAIAFKKGNLADKFKDFSLVNIIASLDLNTWNDSVTPQLIINEIFPV